MSPRRLAPGKYNNIDRRHHSQHDDLQNLKGVNWMLSPGGVVHDVHYEGNEPDHEVDHWVDEEETKLALDCLAALDHGVHASAELLGVAR